MKLYIPSYTDDSDHEISHHVLKPELTEKAAIEACEAEAERLRQKYEDKDNGTILKLTYSDPYAPRHDEKKSVLSMAEEQEAEMWWHFYITEHAVEI